MDIFSIPLLNWPCQSIFLARGRLLDRDDLLTHFIFEKQKTFSVFSLSYTKTSKRLGERAVDNQENQEIPLIY